LISTLAQTRRPPKRRAFPGFEKRRNEQMARKDWTYFQNPVNDAAVLIAVEVWKLLDRLGLDGDMQGRIKDFEELGDEERAFAVLKASVLVQAKLSRWPDDGDHLMREFARASEGSAGTDAQAASPSAAFTSGIRAGHSSSRDHRENAFTSGIRAGHSSSR
jgi:hypothetical protein